MLIRNKKTFSTGLLLAISFVGILFVIFMPIFGEGRNGLEFSDSLFNKLSKGSSYFIPELRDPVKSWDGKSVTFAVKFSGEKDKAGDAEKAAKLLNAVGAMNNVQGAEVKATADLGKMLATVLDDSDAMYKDDAKAATQKYGFDGKEALTIWWNMLSKAMKELQKEKKLDEANIISEVMKKGIEPAFNFYGIEAQNVLDKAGLMTFLLLFYVAYTMWWGYAIFYMFDGIGLSMKKSKVKKEV